MIDEKGRLFGKINIVDLLVILVVVWRVFFHRQRRYGRRPIHRRRNSYRGRRR